MGRGDIIISTIYIAIALRRHVVGIESIVVTRIFVKLRNRRRGSTLLLSFEADPYSQEVTVH